MSRFAPASPVNRTQPPVNSGQPLPAETGETSVIRAMWITPFCTLQCLFSALRSWRSSANIYAIRFRGAGAALMYLMMSRS